MYDEKGNVKADIMIKCAVGIIGCGNMGGAIARGIVSRGRIPAREVYMYDRDSDKAVQLAAETGCRRDNLSVIVRDSEILLIAVKPGDFKALTEVISADIGGAIITSIMAGVKISEIVSCLGKDFPIVRAMPNLAASLQQSVTCLTCNDKAREIGAIEKVKEIFLCIGDVVDVKENEMDIVTAISGSGPAYLFSLAEAMLEGAMEEGLSEDVARKLVSGTLTGASLLLKGSDNSPSELINMVASKGGTTEAALSVFTSEGFRDIVKKAIVKAKARSVEMSGGVE